MDGTPVYDVKPYIPWDSVYNGHTASLAGAESGVGVGEGGASPAMLPPSCPLRVPPWVTADDGEFSRVVFTPEARAAVAEARARGVLAPLYPPLKKGTVSTNEVEDECEVCAAVCEVISQDPRSHHDGRGKATTGAYGMTFNTLRVSFAVAVGADGKGTATVVAADEDPGDPSAPPGTYQHSMHLRRRAEAEAAAMGRKACLRWRHPVREGVVRGLLDLKGGGKWKLSDPDAASV